MRELVSTATVYPGTELQLTCAGIGRLTFGQGQVVAVESGPTVFHSADGLNWVRHFADTNVVALNDVAYHNGTFVVVGSGGAILQSDPVIRLELRSPPHSALALAGMEGRSYRIECLDDLVSTNQWKELATIVLTNSPALWTDSTSSNTATRFYRAVMLPQGR